MNEDLIPFRSVFTNARNITGELGKAVKMRSATALLGLGIALLVIQPVASRAQAPDGVVEFSGGSVAAGIGYSWGSGTLIFQGRRYPLKVSGLSIGSVGISDYTAAGDVIGLKRPEDINGNFTSVGAGATLGGGGNIAAMRNQNGVVIHLTSTTQGLSLSIAASGVKVSLAQ